MVTPLELSSQVRPGPLSGIIELADIFRVVGRGWRVIVVATLLCALIPYAGSFLIPNYFQAFTRILVNPEGLRVFEFDLQRQEQTSASDAHVANQLEVIVSRPILAELVQREKLQDDPEFGAASSGLEPDQRVSLSVDTLAKRVSVKQIETSEIIELVVRDRDPQRAARFANDIADIYVKRSEQLTSDNFKRLSDDLASMLDQQRSLVEAADRAVNDYRTRNNLAVLDGEPDVTRQITVLNQNISDAAADISLSQTTIDQLDAASGNADARLVLPDNALTPSIILLGRRYNESREELQVISAQVGMRHPAYQSAAERMRTIKATLDSELRNHIAASRRNLQTLKAEQGLLNDQMDRLKAKLNATDKTMVELRELERDLTAKRTIYEALLLRTRQLSEQAGIASNPPEIISAAAVPLQKAGPSRLTIAILGGMSGLLLSMAFVLLTGDLLRISARKGLAA